jgi:NADH-quinone oxidoreductase E subunit
MSEIRLTDKQKIEIDAIMKNYPESSAVVIPALQMMQEAHGYITPEICKTIGEYLKVPPVKVYETATFYTMFNKEPVGKYHLQFCNNVSCSLLGSGKLISHIEEKLGIKLGETTEDKLFTLTGVECLGSCGTAPVMMVNDDYHENMDIEKLEKLIEDLKNKK